MASTLNTFAPLEKFTVRNDYAMSCNVTLQDNKFAKQTCLLPKPPTSMSVGTEKNKDILIEFVSLVTGMQKSTFADVRLENTELTTRFYDEKPAGST